MNPQSFKVSMADEEIVTNYYTLLEGFATTNVIMWNDEAFTNKECVGVQALLEVRQLRDSCNTHYAVIYPLFMVTMVLLIAAVLVLWERQKP